MKPSLETLSGLDTEKQLLCVAIAGQHNLLFIGKPGCGKSALCEASESLLPTSNWRQAIKRLLSGLPTNPSLVRINQATTLASLLGGGRSNPTKGALSLADSGILYADEILELRREVLESLRTPLETGAVEITRNGLRSVFPCRFSFLATANDCPCARIVCVCPPATIERYRKKLSGALLDRFDIVRTIHAATPSLRHNRSGQSTYPLAAYRQAINQALARQARRGLRNNALALFHISEPVFGFSAQAINELERLLSSVSARSVTRIARLARTMADLLGDDSVSLALIQDAYAANQSDKEKLQCNSTT